MQLRKLIGFVLSLLVLASNSGFAFSVHYCGDEIASVKPIVFSAQKGCCGKTDSEPMGCCKTKIVKAEKKHETTVKTFSFSFEAVQASEASFKITEANADLQVEKPIAAYSFQANAPPLFKLYSQYIFYA